MFGLPKEVAAGSKRGRIVRAFKTILVATDFSDSAREALGLARRLADTFNASLHILHVVTEPLHEAWSGFVPAGALLETVDHLQSEARQRLETLVGHDHRVIVATSWGDAGDEIL